MRPEQKRIIDHSTTTGQAAGRTGGKYGKGGDLLYRWGNPAQYNMGTTANEMLWQQHCCTWIPANCPGAGHILIHNNGVGRGYTSIDEIAPPVDAAGNYYRAPGAAFGPTTLYWTYQDSVPTNFYGADIGGAEREPNGNTLICYGVHGTLFEVNTTGTSVWNYVNPVVHSPLAQGAAIPLDSNKPGQWYNEVFKVHRYESSFAGLAGKDLTPRGTIETYDNAATDTVGLGLPDVWVRSHFGSLAAVTSTSDLDGDGWSDIAEFSLGTDPAMADSDGDGIPDGWEVTYGLEPTYGSDGDGAAANGHTFLESYLADLNPTNPDSKLRINAISVSGSDVKITWIGGTKAWQSIEYCRHLADPNDPWSVIYTAIPPTATINQLIHQGDPGQTGFYRLKAWR